MKRSLLAVLVWSLVVVFTATASGTSEKAAKETGKTNILWWSHWANEPAKKQTIETVAKDYMAAHPDVNIELVWWDLNPQKTAFRTAMTAGGAKAPDIVSFDTGDIPNYVDAGWLAPLDSISKDSLSAAAYRDGIYKGKLYKLNLAEDLNMILYNRDIMKKLGITVPSDFQFTSAEYLDTVKKAKAAGYAGAANAIGDRPYPAAMVALWMLLTTVSEDEYQQLMLGEKSWDTPQVHQALNYFKQLGEAGFWPPSFSTMGIDAFHVFFHTQQKALYLWIPSWYTGRAFKAVSEGGQSPDFHFGMLRYPKLPGAAYPNVVTTYYETGYGVSTAREANRAVAEDILKFFAQPKYGALWQNNTYIPSAIKFDPAKFPPSGDSKWAWYNAEVNKVYGGLPTVAYTIAGQSGAMADAVKSNLNEGIPEGLVTVDQAIQNLDNAEKQK